MGIAVRGLSKRNRLPVVLVAAKAAKIRAKGIPDLE